MNQTYLGHNTNSEMDLKAQHLVFIFRTNESYGRKVEARWQLNISVQSRTYEARFPLDSHMAVASRRHRKPPSVTPEMEPII